MVTTIFVKRADEKIGCEKIGCLVFQCGMLKDLYQGQNP